MGGKSDVKLWNTMKGYYENTQLQRVTPQRNPFSAASFNMSFSQRSPLHINNLASFLREPKNEVVNPYAVIQESIYPFPTRALSSTKCLR